MSNTIALTCILSKYARSFSRSIHKFVSDTLPESRLEKDDDSFTNYSHDENFHVLLVAVSKTINCVCSLPLLVIMENKPFYSSICFYEIGKTFLQVISECVKECFNP